jgi:flagellar basal-body rod modification protein FlgD
MASAPIDTVTGGQLGSSNNAQNAQAATDAFGLGFEDLLKIVLTQLTYQDPLKPMENFEFVSQLAQFAQIQQTTNMSDNLETLVAAQSTSQAASLLGRRVDIPAGQTVLTGKVTAVAFGQDGTTITIQTATNQTISNIALSSVSQIREAN